LKLNYSFGEIAQIIAQESISGQEIIQSISFDTRRIINGEHTLFFTLNGVFRNGKSFIDDAYSKGVRHFVVAQKGSVSHLKDAKEIVVKNTLSALEKLAKHHRSLFNGPVVAITGSNGKTTVKEWLATLLSGEYTVARSPKSYNSRLGVALSLLEINNQTDIALIEVGIGEKGTLQDKREIIQPTHGILTSFGNAHRELFTTIEEHFIEKITLFENLPSFLFPEKLSSEKLKHEHGEQVPILTSFISNFELKNDAISTQNLSLTIRMAQLLGISDTVVKERIKLLSPLAQRMEIFDGKEGNTIINDTYNLDIDSLEYSLSYQLSNAGNKPRIVLLGTNEKEKFNSILSKFQPLDVHYINAPEEFTTSFTNSNILITGSRGKRMDLLAQKMKQLNHQTFLEFNLKSIRHNIQYFKSKLKPDTKLLCMVKASSYGSDAKNIGVFLESIGVDYLGVAYPNEGIELRQKGIKTPILVMNCEEQSFNDCIHYDLEPAIFSIQQLDSFVKTLIIHSKFNYPIHLKIETGMNRLGFIEKDIQELIAFIHAQPEILVKSIYSHLAESDVVDSEFTYNQIKKLERISEEISRDLPYPTLRHILNSEGIKNYTSAQMEMVRLGIGMYGVNGEKELRQAISWFSSISQIKTISKGETVGYGRSFVATNEMDIAIIPVGYADGLSRQLSENNFGVYIQNTFYPLVGTICMDMIMVDVSGISAQEGDSVEIIGKNQTVLDLATKTGTISYEIMTRFSSRLHRKYID